MPKVKEFICEILCNDGIRRSFISELDVDYKGFEDKVDADGNRGEPKVRYEVNEVKIITCNGKPYKAKNRNELEQIKNKIASMFRG